LDELDEFGVHFTVALRQKEGTEFLSQKQCKKFYPRINTDNKVKVLLLRTLRKKSFRVKSNQGRKKALSC
jgi:hypothetical protein